MKSKAKNIILMVLAFFTLSCEDILDKVPLDGPASVSFLQTEDELIMAINGAYNNLWFHSISATGQWEYILDCASDISWDRNNSIIKTISNGDHSSTDGDFATMWAHLYSGIARCNFILDNIERVEDAAQETRDQVDGQARFLRAYWYSQLVYLWGDVPFITSTLGLEDNNTPRTERETIVNFLLEDLDVSAQKLPETWGTADKGRATSGAALALKSRIALEAGRYEVARNAAKEVIDLELYSLFPDYRALFTYAGESCSEVIFEIMYQYGVEDHRMSYSVGSRNSRCTSTKVPTQAMIDSYECVDGLAIDQSPLYDPANPFENRDPRLKQAIATPGDIFLGFQFESNRDSVTCWNYNVDPPQRIPNQDALNPYATFTGYLWKKMGDPIDYPEFRNNSSLNFIIIRLGEVLLNYAEAKIELNEIDQDCLNAINAVRGRESVNMPPITSGLTQSEMRTIIRRERKIELAMEGFRLMDIRRWNIADEVMPGPMYGRPQLPYSYSDLGIPTFSENGHPDYTVDAEKLRVVAVRTFNSARDYLWPIPQKDIDVNSELEQNPGY